MGKRTSRTSRITPARAVPVRSARPTNAKNRLTLFHCFRRAKSQKLEFVPEPVTGARLTLRGREPLIA